jgi:hypothetical protein
VQCAGQLYRLGQAFHLYASVHQQHLLPWSGWHVAGGDGTGETIPARGTDSSPVVRPADFAGVQPSVVSAGLSINYFSPRAPPPEGVAPDAQRSDVEQLRPSGDTTHGHLYPLRSAGPCSRPTIAHDDAVGPLLAFSAKKAGSTSIARE